MTGFGIYIVIVMIFGIGATLYYAGRGGQTTTPGVLLFSAAWSTCNLLGIIFIGTGLGI